MKELPTGALIGLMLVFIGCALVAAGWITCVVAIDRYHKQRVEGVRQGE